jgi:hypothetical protein
MGSKEELSIDEVYNAVVGEGEEERKDRDIGSLQLLQFKLI